MQTFGVGAQTGEALMKRIFFIRPLVERLRSKDPPKATYRTTRKKGTYYVATGSWFKAKHEGIIIEIKGSKAVDPRRLTDEDARLAGIESVKKLLALFKKWYGKVPEVMYRSQIVKISIVGQGDVHEQTRTSY